MRAVARRQAESLEFSTGGRPARSATGRSLVRRHRTSDAAVSARVLISHRDACALPAIPASDRHPDRAFPAAAACASGTCRRFTRMRVQVDDRPRIESTSTSSTARSAGRLGILALPSFQTRQRGLLDPESSPPPPAASSRAALRRRLGARRRHPRRFALHLAKVRRPRRVAEPRGLVFGRQLQQRFERTRRGVHALRADRRAAAKRFGIVSMVKSAGSQSGTSCQ